MAGEEGTKVLFLHLRVTAILDFPPSTDSLETAINPVHRDKRTLATASAETYGDENTVPFTMSNSPTWLRDQILGTSSLYSPSLQSLMPISANARALHPDKSMFRMDFMTGRMSLAPNYSLVNADGTFVTQYMYYANVYCLVPSPVHGGPKWKMEIVELGMGVMGNVENAMDALAGLLEVGWR
ncbi:uncharacterized protein N0V89_009265 [Didymosphaeria variabile]|uniref:Uncharacterized protein n=1 Tax=Didymosphaeria variabile TaxID=1932322 RepID=A0A9W9C735_9PLEO|nr:uncharacterized protein N0V89_009265 [Didymosphaeria variabile]KAJ4347893.1 hypothetical protein N0V89_009265 [Didymosphaeria variabile]